MRYVLAVWFGKIIGALLHLIAPTRGTNLPGVMVAKLDRNFLAHLRRYRKERFIFITGTNGKSTTTALLTHILRRAGLEVATNSEGANMVTGIITMLLHEMDGFGRLKDKWYVIECDERNLLAISQTMSLEQLLVVNLSEDQIQRNADPGFILGKIKDSIGKNTTMIVNGDEPRSRSLGALAGKSYTCGIEPFDASFASVPSFYATPCPCCGSELDFAAMNCAFVGSFVCHSCGFSSKTTDYLATEVDFANGTMLVNGEVTPICVSVPFFIYNQLLTMAAAERFCGLTREAVRQALYGFANVRGRHDSFMLGTKPLIHLKFKQENPETLQNVFRLIGSDKRRKIIYFSLCVIQDFPPCYVDTAYMWTVPLEAYGAIENATYFSGDAVTCYEGARWLHANGVSWDNIRCLPETDAPALFVEWSKSDAEVIYVATWSVGWDENFGAYEGKDLILNDYVNKGEE